MSNDLDVCQVVPFIFRPIRCFPDFDAPAIGGDFLYESFEHAFILYLKSNPIISQKGDCSLRGSHVCNIKRDGSFSRGANLICRLTPVLSLRFLPPYGENPARSPLRF